MLRIYSLPQRKTVRIVARNGADQTNARIGAIAAKTKVAWVRTNATVSRRKSEMVSGVVRTTTKPCEGLERRRQPPADALSTLSAA